MSNFARPKTCAFPLMTVMQAQFPHFAKLGSCGTFQEACVKSEILVARAGAIVLHSEL